MNTTANKSAKPAITQISVQSTMPILEHRSYHYGAATLPGKVYVVAVDGDTIRFYRTGDLRRQGLSARIYTETLGIFAHLAERGTRTVLAAALAANKTTPPPAYAAQADDASSKLAGTAPAESTDQFISETIHLAPSPEYSDVDLWRAAEEYGCVMGCRNILIVDTTIDLARQARRDSRFIEVTPDVYSKHQ